jgi:hypothetical protein
MNLSHPLKGDSDVIHRGDIKVSGSQDGNNNDTKLISAVDRVQIAAGLDIDFNNDWNLENHVLL